MQADAAWIHYVSGTMALCRLSAAQPTWTMFMHQHTYLGRRLPACCVEAGVALAIFTAEGTTFTPVAFLEAQKQWQLANESFMEGGPKAHPAPFSGACRKVTRGLAM